MLCCSKSNLTRMPTARGMASNLAILHSTRPGGRKDNFDALISIRGIDTNQILEWLNCTSRRSVPVMQM